MLAQPATVESSRRWEAELRLRYGVLAGRTRLLERQHHGPLVVQRAFHPDADGTCHSYLIHPPGGLVLGDRLVCEVRCEPGARVLITTPAATKLYRMPEGRGEIVQRLSVAAGARLEWLPQETIVFGGARAGLRTQVSLERGAEYVGWEVLCLGRPESGDRFESGTLSFQSELWCDGEPLRIERAEIVGSGRLQAGRYGLGNQPVFAALSAYAPGAVELVSKLREALPPELAADAGVTRVGPVLLARYLGPRVDAAHAVLRRAFAVLRSELWNLEPREPRVWRT